MQYFSKNDLKKLETYLGVKKNPGKDEEKLWKKVEKYQNIFSKIPGVLGVAICNSLAMNACHKDSDIDLFIITQKNRLWTARIFFTSLLSLLGQRKKRKQHAGKFCLSFFITEDAINFSNIAIENDIYLYYWMQTLKPIVNRESIFERFFEENGMKNIPHRSSFSLISPHLTSPNGRGIKGRNIFLGLQLHFSPWEKIVGGLSKIRVKFLRCFGSFLELLLKKTFLPRTKKSFQKLGKPFGVIIADDILKFHDKDRRREISNEIFNEV